MPWVKSDYDILCVVKFHFTLGEGVLQWDSYQGFTTLSVTFPSHQWLSVHPLLCRQSHESNFSLQMFLPCSSYSALVTHILLTNTSVFDRAHPPSHACVTGLKRRSWTDFFLGWAVCFPTSDSVIFSRGLFFFPFKMEIRKREFSRVSAYDMKWGQQTTQGTQVY